MPKKILRPLKKKGTKKLSSKSYMTISDKLGIKAPEAKSWTDQPKKRKEVRIKPVKSYYRQYGDPGYKPADGSKTGN